MTSRRDWQLQQLGITQWALRRPASLLGEVAVVLPDDVRLVLIANPLAPVDHPLVGDVARCLDLTLRQLYPLTPDQAEMLPEGTRCHSWWLGGEATRSLSGVTLSTPSLAELQGNAAAKRDLWHQICHYEHDLSADGR
ncbi:DNA polymerase III subunit psi [Acerihabitans arboris]|uniref:DNA polymerase III subunit psi n=1 Tax=Acerihabitans arboris TaxID=2691583 RepID=A0A845SJ63_9GAMM|nr:DNA polymerase III subunit psi [Acerihabitans arboris]NDL61375.1 DNA polymerase III subunit psi [Acerihabitans arboris]